MAIPIYLNELDIELTRRCNAKCAHCMRGDAQDKDMSIDTINRIFYNSNHIICGIGEILISGGEPLLNKDALVYLLKYLIDCDIVFENTKLGIVSNGLIYDEKIMQLLEKLSDKCIVKMGISTDQFHPKISFNNKILYMQNLFVEFGNKKLKEKDILLYGRAKDNNIGNVKLTNKHIELYDKLASYLLIRNVLNTYVSINRMHVTPDGNFSPMSANGTWDMIDDKCKLNIYKNSIFEECEFNSVVLERIKTGKVLLPCCSYIDDFLEARKDGNLNMFLTSLNDNIIRKYLTIDSGPKISYIKKV